MRYHLFTVAMRVFAQPGIRLDRQLAEAERLIRIVPDSIDDIGFVE